MSEAAEDEVYAYLRKLVGKYAIEVFAINGMEDHVHIVVQLKPDPAVIKVIQDTKAYSSGWFKRRFRRAAFSWQKGYAAFTISPSQLDKAVNYVRKQKAHHAKPGFDYVAELKMLCKLHGVEFDERMVE